MQVHDNTCHHMLTEAPNNHMQFHLAGREPAVAACVPDNNGNRASTGFLAFSIELLVVRQM